MVQPATTQQTFDMAIDDPSHSGTKFLDDDGCPKRTGTVWTASAHIITAVIGSGVLSLAWALAQLGWVAGIAVMVIFSGVSGYMGCLLSACYRSGDSTNGKRNYTYMDAVRSHLGGYKVHFCGIVQYLFLFGTAIGYTIASTLSIVAIKKSSCLRKAVGNNPFHVNANPYMIAFGLVQIILSQIPGIDELWWLSYVAAAMSFTYSTIGLLLGIVKTAENGEFKGSITGVKVGSVTPSQKLWRTFQALGNIALAYSYAVVLLEIEDTIKSPPSEEKTMKKATLISMGVTSVFYLLCGCMGYAAFGDGAPGNLLTGFGYFKVFWLLDLANAAIVIHLVGSYQVFSQPIFAFIEKAAATRLPDNRFISKEITLRVPYIGTYKLSLFRLVWRTLFVIVVTMISMALPFFNAIIGFLGALSFWPLTVYFPVEMYISSKKTPKWSTTWIGLRLFSFACLVVTVAAGAGSIADIVMSLHTFEPFKGAS